MDAVISLISSMATREVLSVLTARYQQAFARTVTVEAAGGVDVTKRVRRGEAFDVVVLARDAVDPLIGEGRLVAGSRVDLVKSGIAVAIRAGSRRPDIGDEAAVRAAVVGARSVSYSTGPSGVYLKKLFERWGVIDDVRRRIVVPPPGMPVASLIADGSAELGFQQLSELKNAAGIEVLGPLPPAIQHVTVFCGALAVAGTRAAEARALLDYLASPETAAVKRQHGMDPV